MMEIRNLTPYVLQPFWVVLRKGWAPFFIIADEYEVLESKS